MRNKETFDRVRQGILNQLESHRKEIEEGELKWFTVRVGWSHHELLLSWQHEENGQPLTNGQNPLLRR